MKSSTLLLKEIKRLNKENTALKQQLLEANKSTMAMKAGQIDALVVAHKKAVKIYTAPTADKTYRILIEKMQEGAVTVNQDGMILYCNSYFAKMVARPLEKVIGTKLKSFMDGVSKKTYTALFKQGWEGYAQDEVYLHTTGEKTIPVLMSANTLILENTLVLSIMLTDLTLQRSRLEFKIVLIEKIIKVIAGMNEPGHTIDVNNSDYISEQLNYDYTYLSNIFSEVKGITIQQFIIANKIEKVKELLVHGELSLTEISYNLQYSSVAHLSHQFKKFTGFTPTYYLRNKQKEKINGAVIKK